MAGYTSEEAIKKKRRRKRVIISGFYDFISATVVVMPNEISPPLVVHHSIFVDREDFE
jgi:hypothetical protein